MRQEYKDFDTFDGYLSAGEGVRRYVLDKIPTDKQQILRNFDGVLYSFFKCFGKSIYLQRECNERRKTKNYEATTMKVQLTVVLLSTIGFVFANDDVAGAFEAAELKPDILDKAPTHLIKVRYGNKIVNLGNELTPTQARNIPEIYYNHNRGALYTLIMTDPDSPSRETPTRREIRHWIVGNIIGNDISTGDTLVVYNGPAPRRGTGLHRYAFLVYKQPGWIYFNEQRLTNTSSVGRPFFSTNDFTAKYHLGDPIAGNYFQAQFDC